MKKGMIFLIIALIPVGVAAQELNVPALIDGAGPTIGELMRSIIIPSVEFKDTPVEDAVEFLRLRSVALDMIQDDPDRKGINIVLKTPPGWSAGAVSLADEKAFSFSSETNAPRITLKLKGVPLDDALRHVAEAAGLEMRVEGLVVVLAPPAEDVASLISSLEAAIGRLATDGEGALPPTLYESLQSEYRVLEAQDERLRAQGVAEESARRVALAATMAVTKEKIEAARALLEEFLRKEKALAEAWVEEAGGK